LPLVQTVPAPRAPVEARTPRRVSWDLIRVIAVLAVLLQHATHAGPANHPELGVMPFTDPLEMGASTLVVLSAFFACASLSKGRPARFLAHRLARLLPAYALAVVVTFLVLRWLAPPGWSELTTRDVVLNVLMMQNWLPDVRFVDFSYWTLPVQVFGFVAGALLYRRWFGRGVGLRVLLWGLVAGPLVIRLWTDDPGFWRTVFDGFALHRAQLFAAGIGIWLWSKRRLGGPHLAALLAATLVATYVHAPDLGSTLALGGLLLAICAAAAGPDWRRGPLKVLARPLSWLAGISFGIYLVHQEIGYVVMVRLTQLGLNRWLVLAGFLVSAVLLGWLLTRHVERPVYRWLTTPAGASRHLVPMVLAFRLRRARWVTAELAQIQLGRVGGLPLSPEPSSRPVSHPRALAAEPVVVLAGSAAVSLQLR
jgi:peptidoglycan/LPS O-acetylase OafA/YrhL